MPVQTYRLKNGKSPIWAFDSEFLVSGRAGHSEDVASVQFSNGDVEHSVVLECPSELKDWLHKHDSIKTLYGFVVLCDLGSVSEWLGTGHVSCRKNGSQTVGRVKYRGFNCDVYDSQPLLSGLGLGKLEKCGAQVGYPKLRKPDWLGLRHWHDEAEHREFLDYAIADAIITAKIVEWLRRNFNADPKIHASTGTLAKDELGFPKRLVKGKGRNAVLPPLERVARACCFAGRNEGFVTGFTRNVRYNDVKNLYGVNMAVSRALLIAGAAPCALGDLSVSSDSALDDSRFGWVEGIFETDRDMWGLPLRAGNNTYVMGVVQGFFHTFDLVAAKAKVLSAAHCYRPIFSDSKRALDSHNRLVEMLLGYLERRVDEIHGIYNKGVLRSASGKLGQSHPIAETSNFFAYSTLLAHSHLCVSRMFDKCSSPIIAMDTDSIFSQSDMSGKWFDLSDGEHTIPLIMAVKGAGDLMFFRSKNYILWNRSKPHNTPNDKQYDPKELDNPVVGRANWDYFYEDFEKLFDCPTEIVSRKDIKHSLLTRQRKALELIHGYWCTEPVTLSLEKLKDLLKADLKRERTEFDSYGLCMEQKNCASHAWSFEQLMNMCAENPLDFPYMAIDSRGQTRSVQQW